MGLLSRLTGLNVGRQRRSCSRDAAGVESGHARTVGAQSVKANRRSLIVLLIACLAALGTNGLGCRSPELPEAVPGPDQIAASGGGGAEVPLGSVYGPPAQDQASTIRFDQLSVRDGLS